MNIPFLWVPITALACYLVMLVTLLPASGNRAVKAFCRQLFCFVFWTGGSMLMRMSAWPGIMFWYEVSLVGLFLIPAMLYHFLAEFFEDKRSREKWLVWLFTALAVIPAVFDAYLEKPILEALPGGITVFRYHPDWRILIPAALCLTILVISVRLVWRQSHNASFSLVLAGMVILGIGNFVSVLPGNIFPFDALSAIINAGLVFWALYRRRLFKLRVFFSAGTVSLLTGLIVCALAVPCTRILKQFITYCFGGENPAYTLPALWCAAVLITISLTHLLHVLVQHFLLGRERQQSLVLQQFGAATIRSPGGEMLVNEIVTALEQLYGSRPVCIFLLDEEGDAFAPVYPPKLHLEVNPICRTDPCAVWFSGQRGCIRTSQLSGSGLKVPADKAALIRRHHISCIVPFQDDAALQGILFLGSGTGQKDYTGSDLVFLDSLGSMISLAFKNARLYSQLFREARTDQLTGLLNRRAFIEALEQQLKAETPLALVMLNLDDFKLYNQLYGNAEGDRALECIAKMLDEQTRGRGIAARYSGKVFGAMLFDAGGDEGLALARHMSSAVASLTDEKFCGLTFSSGVYGYIGGVVDAQQALEFVDVAVFEVKHTGKSGVRLYGSTVAKGMDGIAQAEQPYISTIYAITAAIDARDHYTFSHSQNVADYARALAGAIGMDDVHVQMIYQAGLVHDVGKLAIPEAILSKPGPLTPEERHIMEGHVESSVPIIRNLPSLDYVIPAAITHHERWDGKGYPRGLSGTDIPLGGRCLALADAFDAMISLRSYKKAYTVDYALQQLRECAGTQFDPELVPVFIRLVEDGTIHPEI